MIFRAPCPQARGWGARPALRVGRALALLAFSALLPATLLHAEQSWALIEENFSGADGMLAAGGNSPWRRQIGTPPIRIANQTAVIGPGDGAEGYLTRSFAQLGLQTESPPAVEARFTFRLSAASGQGPLERGANGTLLQFASADGRQRRGRLLFRTLIEGTYQLGVCTKSSTAVVWGGRSFQADSEHSVLLVYDSTVGKTRVWIDPDPSGSLGAPLAEATDSDSTPPGRVSLQVNSTHGPHHLRIDDLFVQPFGEIK